MKTILLFGLKITDFTRVVHRSGTNGFELKISVLNGWSCHHPSRSTTVQWRYRFWLYSRALQCISTLCSRVSRCTLTLNQHATRRHQLYVIMHNHFISTHWLMTIAKQDACRTKLKREDNWNNVLFTRPFEVKEVERGGSRREIQRKEKVWEKVWDVINDKREIEIKMG